MFCGHGFLRQLTHGVLIQTLPTFTMDLHIFTLNCHWTNDAVERSVLKKLNCLFYQKKTFRLIAVLKERVPTTHGEDTLQQIVTVTTDERARVRRGKGNHFNKDALQNMLRK